MLCCRVAVLRVRVGSVAGRDATRNRKTLPLSLRFVYMLLTLSFARSLAGVLLLLLLLRAASLTLAHSLAICLASRCAWSSSSAPLLVS